MKQFIKYIAVGAFTAVAAMNASAQSTRSGYFVDDYTYRYEMNPALGNSKSFVAVPAVGNFNFGLSGNLAVTDVLYNVNGRTTTFLNPNVSTKEVMGNLNDNNHFGFDLKMPILATGFKAFGGYNTIALNARSSFGINLPREIFSLLKEGVANKSYDISDISSYANAYTELSFGHSRQITKEWRAGAAVKVLIGLANTDARLKNTKLTLGEDSWTIKTEAVIDANIKGFKYETDINKDTGHEYVSGADLDGFGVGGFGLAFDFGAVYTPEALKDWSFSASLLDLGFISWSNDARATTHGVKTFNTDKYTFNVDDDAPNSFDNEWEKIQDDLAALYELDDDGNKGSQTRALAATFNLGAQYTLPTYRKATFGLLNTTRIQGEFSWTEFRLSANVAPLKSLDAGINLVTGTYGTGFGWLINYHPKGVGFFLGMDRTLGKLAKQGLPLSSNAHVNVGMNVLF